VPPLTKLPHVPESGSRRIRVQKLEPCVVLWGWSPVTQQRTSDGEQSSFPVTRDRFLRLQQTVGSGFKSNFVI